MNKYIEKPSEHEQDLIDRLNKEIQAPKGSCPTCHGLGGWTNEQDQYTFCECQKEQMFFNKCIKSGVPRKNLGKSLVDWNLKQDVWGNNLTQNALDKKGEIKLLVERYMKVLPAVVAGNPIKIVPKVGNSINITSLLFEGGQWSGKTLLGTLIAQQAIKHNLKTEFIDWSELYSDLSGFENKDRQTYWSETFANMDMIILDGVDYYEMRNPTLAINLDRVSRSRTKSGKPIVITAYPGYDKIEAGHGWSSLVASCFQITLPTPHPPKPYAS